MWRPHGTPSGGWPSHLIYPYILARYTAFAHEGDFGQMGPWSADATPPVDEPRISVSLEPSF